MNDPLFNRFKKLAISTNLKRNRKDLLDSDYPSEFYSNLANFINQKGLEYIEAGIDFSLYEYESNSIPEDDIDRNYVEEGEEEYDEDYYGEYESESEEDSEENSYHDYDDDINIKFDMFEGVEFEEEEITDDDYEGNVETKCDDLSFVVEYSIYKVNIKVRKFRKIFTDLVIEDDGYEHIEELRKIHIGLEVKYKIKSDSIWYIVDTEQHKLSINEDLTPLWGGNNDSEISEMIFSWIADQIENEN